MISPNDLVQKYLVLMMNAHKAGMSPQECQDVASVVITSDRRQVRNDALEDAAMLSEQGCSYDGGNMLCHQRDAREIRALKVRDKT